MLVSLLVAVIILGLLFYMVQVLPLAQPFKSVAYVILVIIAILYMTQFLPSGPHLFYR